RELEEVPARIRGAAPVRSEPRHHRRGEHDEGPALRRDHHRAGLPPPGRLPVSGDTKYVTLDCGCEILIRQEWEYGSWEWSGGLINTPCAFHTPEECPCENCERCRE